MNDCSIIADIHIEFTTFYNIVLISIKFQSLLVSGLYSSNLLIKINTLVTV